MADQDIEQGHNEAVMFSSLTAEATYNAIVAAGAANFQTFRGHAPITPNVGDVVQDDTEDVNDSEGATIQELIEERKTIPFNQPKATPNALAFWAMACLGDKTTTADGVGTAQRHYFKPIAANVALKSFNTVHKVAGDQWLYKGCKGNMFKISSEASGLAVIEAEAGTQGKRVTNDDAFVASVIETWLRAADTKVYIKENPVAATDIVAEADLSQDGPNIDGVAAAITSIGKRTMSYSLEFNNSVEDIPGHGGDGGLQEINYKSRVINFSMGQHAQATTDLAKYSGQTPLAIEINCKSTVIIDGTGTFYYGFIFRIPLCQIKVSPEPEGGKADAKTSNIEITVLDDGINPRYDMAVYNNIADYLV